MSSQRVARHKTCEHPLFPEASSYNSASAQKLAHRSMSRESTSFYLDPHETLPCTVPPATIHADWRTLLLVAFMRKNVHSRRFCASAPIEAVLNQVDGTDAGVAVISLTHAVLAL